MVLGFSVPQSPSSEMNIFFSYATILARIRAPDVVSTPQIAAHTYYTLRK